MASKKTVTMKSEPLGKSYEPVSFESDIYRFWEENGCFEAADESAPGQNTYCIVIPPPNVTGVLHIGHALGNSIQDTLIRWRRMKGDNTLWMPGTDHAGIATQAQVEKHLKKTEKKSRHDIGREEFVKRTWAWKEEHGSKISNQTRRLGASLDWSRERFTMDPGMSRAVREVFVRLHEQKLIYRGERVINWCSRCQTALSDLEVVPTETKGNFYHIKYQVVDSDESIVIATTRPETMLADTAIAVHPDDERYAHLHGKKVLLPILGRELPIITDSYVDREFGSGGLKVTPAHDFNDYDIGLRHKLPVIQAIGKDGKMTVAGGPFAGLKVLEARERVVQQLKEDGSLIKIEDHTHQVGHCQRCSQIAEPIISKQWFVDIKPLAEPAIEAVRKKKIQFVPANWEKTYYEWMENIRDWCISRQLWWGHQIPAWYCDQCQEVTVSREDPTQCSSCKAAADHLKQDEDVLDTWFSSGLWPFATLGWPDKTKALDTFYPGAVLETGFDIIFFWVARMIMMGIHFMDDVPFKTVYMHAMVRDSKGQKMSKSRGNVIDPLVLVDKTGADPLRFTLLIMAGQGRDIKLSEERIVGYKAFCNKLWNAVKFFHHNWDQGKVKEPDEGAERWLLERKVDLLPSNRWILSEFHRLVQKVNSGMETYDLNQATQAIYDFTWREFCDWFIEFSKLSLNDPKDREQTLITLSYVTERLLRLLHPFLPFLTEKLWQSMPWKKPAINIGHKNAGKPIETIMLQTYPESNGKFIDGEVDKSINALKSVIEAIRTFRGETKISPKVKFPVTYRTDHNAADILMKMNASEILEIARIESLERVESVKKEPCAIIPLNTPPVELRIKLEGLVDIQGETTRLRKEIDKVNSDLGHVKNKLSKETFVTRAPEALVAKERDKQKYLEGKLKELEASLQRLSG